MKKSKTSWALIVGASALLAGVNANAATPDTPTLKPNAAPQAVLRDRPLEEMKEWRAPAATIDSRPSADYADNYANDVGDGLFFAPGVTINKLDVNEPRIVLRGFGLGNRQERSTAPVLRDGAPLTDVHGSTNSQEIDLLAIDRIDVFRGGAGDFRIAGENLGGVVNLVSPTGLTAGYRRRAVLAGGSSIGATPGGQAHVAAARVAGAFDYWVGATGLYESGFRENNERYQAIFNANIGWRPSDEFSSRVFLEAIYSDAELAGGLSPADAADDPSQAAAPISLGPLFPGGPVIELAGGASDDEFARTVKTGRIANLTEFNVFAHDVDARLHFTRRAVESPQIDFIGLIDEKGHEWGVDLSIDRDTRMFGMDTHYRFGGAYATGSQSSDRFDNLNGDRGAQTIDTDHQSTIVRGFVEATLRPLKKLAVDLGVKFLSVDRELTVADDDAPESAGFAGVSAKGGVLYRLTRKIEIFANLAKTYEPPSFSELISDDPEDFNDLEEQDAFTYEAGFRGAHSDWLSWDATYFHSDVENEIINIDDPEFNGLGTLVNIDETTHEGFEIGLNIDLRPGVTRRTGNALVLRSVYNYNRFFIDDAGGLGVDDGVKLAGVPQHVLRSELRYDADGAWFAAVNMQYAGGAYFADHENALSVPAPTLVGFSAGRRLSDNVEVFISGENVTDANYIAAVTPVTSQSVQNGRIYTPGEGASLYGGLRMRF